MRSSELLLTVALLGGAAMSGWLWSELRAERIRNAELIARATSLPTPVAVPEAAMPVPIPVPVPVPASTTRQTSASNFTATPTSQGERSSHYEQEAAAQRQSLQQPKYREAWRAQQRLNYARRHENVIRLLGFTPEEADAVIEIAIERQLTWIDRALPKAMSAELAQQQQDLYQQDQREDQAKLRELLGEEKSERLQEYMESRNTRVQVDQLRPQFTGEDALRDDQVEPLIAALHVEHTRLRNEQQEYRTSITNNEPAPQGYAKRELQLLKEAHERMHTAAAPVLSDSQLKRLDTLLKREFDRQVLEARMTGTPADASED